MGKSGAVGLREIVFSDREQAEAHLSGIASSISRVDFGGGDFHLAYAGGSIARCSLHRGSVSSLSYTVGRSDEFHFLTIHEGRVRFNEPRRSDAQADHKTGLLIGPDARGRCAVDAASSGISMFTTETAIRGYAEKLIGDGRRIDLVAAGVTQLELSEPIAATFARNVAGTFHELQALGRSGLSSIALTHFDELLLGLAAVSTSPTVRDFVRDKSAVRESAGVRQARDYLHAHAAEPVSFSDLAVRLGIGLRSLQIAFRRELGCSPREYLMSCRLELARTRLTAGGDMVTVTQIALDCGFTDMAVFARKYRETFGERPSDTLRRR